MANITAGTKLGRFFLGNASTKPSGVDFPGLTNVESSFDGGDIKSLSADDNSSWFVYKEDEQLTPKITSYFLPNEMLEATGLKLVASGTENGARYAASTSSKGSVAYITTKTDRSTNNQTREIQVFYDILFKKPDLKNETGNTNASKFEVTGVSQNVTFADKDGVLHDTPMLVVPEGDPKFNFVYDSLFGSNSKLITPQDYVDHNEG